MSDATMGAWDRTKRFVRNYFLFEQRHTTFTNEIRGGFVTFLTMSYILLVNPLILSNWVGGDKGEVYPEKKVALLNNVASSTAAICAFGTFVVGVFSNLPFSIGPGMGMNTFFAGSILVAHTAAEYDNSKATWNLAVTTTFFAGAIIFLASVCNLSQKLIAMLPPVLKSSILVGIGLYQAFVGLRTMNVIESDPTELLKFVSHYDFDAANATGTVSQILFAATLFITAALYVLEVNGAILAGISITTVLCWVFSWGGVSFPSSPVQVPRFEDTFWNFAFPEFFQGFSWIGTCASFVLITLFDVGGIMFGVMSLVQSSIRKSQQLRLENPTAHMHSSGAAWEDGDHDDIGGAPQVAAEDESMLDHHPEIIQPWEARRAFIAVGLATMVSGVLGCSPCIIFLECIAGVASGSRTGFSSVVTAMCFVLSLPFVPLFRSVPSCASSPALLIIGCFMMSSASEVPWHDHKMAMPAFLTIAMMPFTASITPGIVIGIASYIALHSVDAALMRYRIWRGGAALLPSATGGIQNANAASPAEVEARSHPRSEASHQSKASHVHSLGYNVDEPSHQQPGFRVRGAVSTSAPYS